MPVVSISERPARAAAASRLGRTVYHGLPLDLLPLSRRAGRLLRVPRPRLAGEGLDRAIEIAQRGSACRCKIAAKIDRRRQRLLREQHRAAARSRRWSSSSARSARREKDEFLGGARALLFPIDWPEPFGLVMIEAMACGTPVVALRCGSVPELIDDGRDRLRASTSLEEAVEAAARVHRLDRRACRATFERRFSAARMARDYLAVYAELDRRRARRGAPRSHASRGGRMSEGRSRQTPVPSDEDRYQILATSSLTHRQARAQARRDVRRVRPLRRHPLDQQLGAEGLYHEGTRFLSRAAPAASRTERCCCSARTCARTTSLLAVDLMNPDLVRDGQHADRARHAARAAHEVPVRRACYEHIQICELRRGRDRRRGSSSRSAPTSPTCSRCAARAARAAARCIRPSTTTTVACCSRTPASTACAAARACSSRPQPDDARRAIACASTCSSRPSSQGHLRHDRVRGRARRRAHAAALRERVRARPRAAMRAHERARVPRSTPRTSSSTPGSTARSPTCAC